MTAIGRPPDRAREGHGQHLGIPRLKSDVDDRDAGYLGLQHCGAVKPLVTIGRANALMVSRAGTQARTLVIPSTTSPATVAR
jgi:hypothetical protein